MTHLIADDAMLAILARANEIAEIRDTSGHVVGFYAPASGPQAQAPLESIARAYLSELHRRAQNQEPGRTTREVFEHLLAMTVDETSRAYLRKKIEDLKERDRCASL